VTDERGLKIQGCSKKPGKWPANSGKQPKVTKQTQGIAHRRTGFCLARNEQQCYGQSNLVLNVMEKIIELKKTTGLLKELQRGKYKVNAGGALQKKCNTARWEYDLKEGTGAGRVSGVKSPWMGSLGGKKSFGN